jgi:hypothetical protein
VRLVEDEELRRRALERHLELARFRPRVQRTAIDADFLGAEQDLRELPAVTEQQRDPVPG